MRKNKEKKWSEMSREEKLAFLPKKLNKYGEWLLSDVKSEFVINDMRAVLK